MYFILINGIIAVRRIKESDLTKLAKATGARIDFRRGKVNINKGRETRRHSKEVMTSHQMEIASWSNRHMTLGNPGSVGSSPTDATSLHNPC